MAYGWSGVSESKPRRPGIGSLSRAATRRAADGGTLTPFEAMIVERACLTDPGDGSSVRLPFDTVKYRLPIPEALPRVSVTTQEIVWTPLVNIVLSNAATPSAVPMPEYCETGNSADRSDRLVQPEGTPGMMAPSMTTRTVPPDGGSDRAGPFDRTQPKFVTEPETVPPSAGRSIAPTGRVGRLFGQGSGMAPSVGEWPAERAP